MFAEEHPSGPREYLHIQCVAAKAPTNHPESAGHTALGHRNTSKDGLSMRTRLTALLPLHGRSWSHGSLRRYRLRAPHVDCALKPTRRLGTTSDPDPRVTLLEAAWFDESRCYWNGFECEGSGAWVRPGWWPGVAGSNAFGEKGFRWPGGGSGQAGQGSDSGQDVWQQLVPRW